jgi:hypothetical protein
MCRRDVTTGRWLMLVGRSTWWRSAKGSMRALGNLAETVCPLASSRNRWRQGQGARIKVRPWQRSSR